MNYLFSLNHAWKSLFYLYFINSLAGVYRKSNPTKTEASMFLHKDRHNGMPKKKSTIQMTINEDLLTYSIINIFHQWKVEGTTRMQSLKLLQLWWLLDLLERFMWNTEFNQLWFTKLKFLWKKSINITWIFKHVITYINRHMCYCHDQNLTWPFWYLSLIWMLVEYICHSSDWVRLLI